MNWISLVEKMISDECRGKDSEFLKLTGLTTAHLRNWRHGRSSNPQLRTIEKIEAGLKVRIQTDKNGIPVGYERTPAELKSDGSKRAAELPEDSSIPASAQSEYDDLAFTGEGRGWSQLPESERAYFEELFQRMRLIIAEANADRDRKVEQAVNEFRRIMKEKVLGITSK